MANLEDDLHAVFIITCSTLEQAGLTRLKTYVRLTYTGDGQTDGVSHPGRRADVTRTRARVTRNCPYVYLSGEFAKTPYYYLTGGFATTRSTEWGLVLDAARFTAAIVRHDYEIDGKFSGDSTRMT
jgi:hypothetical protein